MESILGAFNTTLGCAVSVWTAPEHLGKGVLVSLRMDDGRYAEVFLTGAEKHKLRHLLDD